MTNEADLNKNNEPELSQEELEAKAVKENLRLKADRLGIKYKSNTTLDTLQKKISEALSEQVVEPDTTIVSSKKQGETTNQRNARLRKESNLLHRVQIICNNPSKKKWGSELFTVSNSIVGTISKTIPYGKPFHVPQLILNLIKEREFQEFVDGKDAEGNKVQKAKNRPEYGITFLDALTKDEIQNLAKRQALEEITENN